jgi:tetratricopeptide (TPR) repeat protein
VLKDPRSGPTWGALGQVFLANEMDDESLTCFAEAERLDPNEPRWPYCQAGVLLNQGRTEVALLYLRQAVDRCTATEPDNDAPRLLLAETLLSLGQLDESEEEFRRVLARKPEMARAHFGLARVTSARQDWQTSRSHLLRCVNSPFARKKASTQLALVCLRLGDEAAAEKYRAQASRLPDDSDWEDPFVTEYLRWAIKKKSRYRLVDSLEAAGRLQEAAAVLRPMAEEYPDDYLPRLTLGKILGQMGDNARAEAVLRESLRLAPNKVQGHHYLSLVLYGQAEQAAREGDPDRARALYGQAADSARQALDLKPDHGLACMSLGLALKRLGQRESALDALRRAVRCNPEYAELHFYLGEMLVETAQQEEAKDQLKQAVEMAPPNAAWKKNALALLSGSPRDDPKDTPPKPNE